MNVPAAPPRRWIHLIIVGYVLFAIFVVAGFALQRANYQGDLRREKATVAASCQDRADAREGVRVAINTVKQIVTLTGAAPDYSRVPGWDDIDATFKTFLQNLTAASGGGGSEFQQSALAALDGALAALPPIVCQPPITPPR